VGKDSSQVSLSGIAMNQPAVEAASQTSFFGDSWGDRCLNAARCLAIATAVSVPMSTALTSLTVHLMVIAWLVSGRAIETIVRAVRQPAGAALAVFLVVAATGLLYGPADFSERWGGFLGWRRIAYALIPLGLFGLIIWKKRFVAAFVIASAVWLVVSYIAWIGDLPIVTYQVPGVLLQNKATQGVVFAFGLWCAIQFARDASSSVRPWLYGLGVALALNIVFITPGRSGYLALFVVLAMCAHTTIRARRAYLWLLIGLAAVLSYAASSTLRERVDLAIAEVRDPTSVPLSSVGTRMVFYGTSLDLIKQRPWLGYGSAGFGKAYSGTVKERYADWRALPSTDPHNIYLFVAVEHGLIGLVVFVGFLSVTLWRAPRDRYGWIGIGALLVIMATSLFSSHFRTFPEAHLLSMFLGAMLASGATSNSANS
jgi:O-antigen ligase